MKILNLYAGIGGNRKLWGDGHDITAVEINQSIADIYADLYPSDNVIVTDAHEYLLWEYENYDFIWSSPPCPSHSKINNTKLREREYPDMRLYQEIIYLDKWFDGKWIVENVDPYYQELIPATKLDRHLFWSNFRIGRPDIVNDVSIKHDNDIETLQRKLGIDLNDYTINNKRQKLRNCVYPEIGKHIIDRAQDIVRKSDTEQTALEI